MNWRQVREQYPQKWVLVEAIEAHSVQDQWLVDQVTVVDAFTDVTCALTSYKQLHKQAPERDYFIVHTNKEQLQIQERRWVGIRTA